ncbi:methionyl-tRNA formyltransferase [Opitutus terrae]|uniref:Methionyl-tRNA formyltransferase n=1 Tax=Opitutus terrae (strain DSM 11246 / JCM 15787 / PB90-1) TaxID=452637 RepID=B1ZX71_OPITP|nr:methionyl-tRNA formyltransferase [Opitutus terrae]ACB76123.1 methionyl-tRNA formyltransferase [Opitutus terrae PB90-1]
MPPLRIVFLGSDPIALPLLEWLAGEGRAIGEIVVVFTQPDRAAGRGQKITPNAIKTWALARGIPVLQPEKVTDEVRTQLAGFAPDVSLVMAYGHILRDEFISTPRLGTLNLHTSILPKYRGASPIQTAVASGDRQTGVTLMRMVRKLDAGPIGDVERVAIELDDTALDVEAKLAAACVPLLQRALPRLRDGTLAFAAQDDSAASYCRKLAKEDGVLDFAMSADVLAARINGLFPWPACSVEIARQPVKFGAATARDLPPSAVGRGKPPGEVLGADTEGLLISTGEGALCVRRMQRPGGRMLPTAEFLRGFPIAVGMRLPSGPMPPLISDAPFPRPAR